MPDFYTKDERSKIDAALKVIADNADVDLAVKLLQVLKEGGTSVTSARVALAGAALLLSGVADWKEILK